MSSYRAFHRLSTPPSLNALLLPQHFNRKRRVRTVLQLFADRSPYYFQLGLVDVQEQSKSPNCPAAELWLRLNGKTTPADPYPGSSIAGRSHRPDRLPEYTNRVGREVSGAVVAPERGCFSAVYRPLLASETQRFCSMIENCICSHKWTRRRPVSEQIDLAGRQRHY
jgi:hypothetical protein